MSSPEIQPRIVEHLISRSAFDAVKELAERHGHTITSEIHTAIFTADFFYSQTDNGGAILIEKDGQFFQLFNPDSEDRLYSLLFPSREGGELDPMDFPVKYKINPEAQAKLKSLSDKHTVTQGFELNRALLLTKYLLDLVEVNGRKILRQERDERVYEVEFSDIFLDY